MLNRMIVKGLETISHPHPIHNGSRLLMCQGKILALFRPHLQSLRKGLLNLYKMIHRIHRKSWIPIVDQTLSTSGETDPLSVSKLTPASLSLLITDRCRYK